MTGYTLNHLTKSLNDVVAQANTRLGHDIAGILREAIAQSDWLPSDRRTVNHQNYARHLLHADPQGRYSILSIVWSPGQKSPIHSHYTWCAVGVLRGEIEETFYDVPIANAAPIMRHTATRRTGSVSFAAAAKGIHSIANRGGKVAISIHVYGVGADRVSTGINHVYG